MKISLIAALAENGVIGSGAELPWHLPKDLKRFKRLTMGHHLLVGRKTYESIGRPLPGRHMLVLTRSGFEGPEGVQTCDSLETALDAARAAGEHELFVAGGAEIYALTLPVADRLHLTRVDAEIDGDVHFPPVTWQRWQLKSRQSHPADERHAYPYRFEVYDRA